jgi:hypothetical protein
MKQIKTMKKPIIFILLFILKLNGLNAQSICFNPMFGGSKLELNKQYFIVNSTDSIQIETLKFYISNMEFYNTEQLVFKEKNSFHLIDAEDSTTFNLMINLEPNINFNQIKFNIGIDSITNYGGAMGGDLDPTKGMYWTWQNGYINFKIEGKSNLSIAKSNDFVFHLGGYQNEFSTLQTIQLPVQNSQVIPINMAIDKWIYEIDLAKQNHIMSPSKEAVILSNKLSAIFSVTK